jgi:hypothetical protein
MALPTADMRLRNVAQGFRAVRFDGYFPFNKWKWPLNLSFQHHVFA